MTICMHSFGKLALLIIFYFLHYVLTFEAISQASFLNFDLDITTERKNKKKQCYDRLESFEFRGANFCGLSIF